MDGADSEHSALAGCEREPIHIPGNIQPFGAMLAGPLSLDQTDFASANLEQFLGLSPDAALHAPMASMLPGEVLHDIRNILSYDTAASQRERAGRYELGGRLLEVYAHRSGANRALLEFEEFLPSVKEGMRSPTEQARLFIAKAGSEPTISKMLRTATACLKSLTGYHRVKAYRYADDGSGSVVAEALSDGAESFLGLHYPAYDVPAQARALQVRNPVRLLSDVEQEPVPVLARAADLDPLDMSLSHLRGVSPIHVQYLKNMGVQATLTVGIVVDGRLWGMFACHHMEPRYIGSDVRIAAELFGQMMSLLIKEKLENSHAEARARAAGARQKIFAETDATKDLLHAFPDIAEIYQELITSDGIAVLRDDKLQTSGSVPSPEAIRRIAETDLWDDNLITMSHSLDDDQWADGYDLQNSAGCLLVRATAAYPLQLMFFRDAVTKKVKWAGKPQKRVEASHYGTRITPRESFAAFLQEKKGHAEPWTSYDATSAKEIQTLLMQLTAKGEQQQLVRHQDLINHQRQQDLMIAELNHRVKNILALIRSLSRQAKDSSASLESYALALEQRIAAMAAAHDLAVSDSMTGVSFGRIIETEINPYASDEASQIIMSGPVIGLRADVAPMIALVLHEVVSNAAKYGALSTKDGVVQIKWFEDDEGLHFHWRELGGPKVTPPKRHGFGRSLIEKAIPYEFDGRADLRYEEAGVCFSFTLPKANLVDLSADEGGDGKSPPKLSGKVGEIVRVASGKSALLVEDNLVLAMDMVESISRLGASKIETAATIDAALLAIGQHSFDFAVLDMNLRGTVAFDVAQKLASTGVPFIFVTGYGSKIDVPPELRDVPILTKPVDDGSLSQRLADLLAAPS